MQLEPVEVVWERVCHYKAQPCANCGKAKSNAVHKSADKGGTCKFKRRMGCLHCGKAKKHPDHFGGPDSVRILGSGSQGAYIGAKEQLEELITTALEGTDLPRPAESILVECDMVFPDTSGRDEGNLKFLLEKALGDALQKGGWLENDTFYPVKRYSFGGITPSYEKGVLRTRLIFFPSLDPPPDVTKPPPASTKINRDAFL